MYIQQEGKIQILVSRVFLQIVVRFAVLLLLARLHPVQK